MVTFIGFKLASSLAVDTLVAVTWLITGGAGYIGGHVVASMRKAGQTVVVLDDLSTGYADRIGDSALVVGSVLDATVVARTLAEHQVTGIIHLAAKKQVEESTRNPLEYYRANVEGLRVLLEHASIAGVDTFLFSSSAAVYGAPDVNLVREDAVCDPINPYGWTKLVGEKMISSVADVTGLRYANLRYFNVAGASTSLLADRTSSNLIPMLFEQISRRGRPMIFGSNYDTSDGTCVRDFIHVQDVATAHVATANALREGRLSAFTANIGRGEGVSVGEVIEVVRRVTGTSDEDWASPELRPRRPGDPARVVASADRLRAELEWKAEFSVEDMVRSAWAAWADAFGTGAGSIRPRSM